jgi:hypothetical protein
MQMNDQEDFCPKNKDRQQYNICFKATKEILKISNMKQQEELIQPI